MVALAASKVVTHEAFILNAVEIILRRLNEEGPRARLERTKIVYGAGDPLVRGRCHYRVWHDDEARDLVEISAFGEESPIQILGTLIHELAHVCAGYMAGHGLAWKLAARLLGLTKAKAAGQFYREADFEADLWAHLRLLRPPNDGKPRLPVPALSAPPMPRPCPAGYGTNKGTSRGKGSGSRLRRWTCACPKPVIVRVASDEFRAICLHCRQEFQRG